MEPDNITIAAALKAYGYSQPSQVAKIMGTDYDHAHSLLQQVEENEQLGTPKPTYLEPHPELDFGGEKGCTPVNVVTSCSKCKSPTKARCTLAKLVAVSS